MLAAFLIIMPPDISINIQSERWRSMALTVKNDRALLF